MVGGGEEEEEGRREEEEGRRKKGGRRGEWRRKKGGRAPAAIHHLVRGGVVPSAPCSRLRPLSTSTLGSPFTLYPNRAMDVGHRAVVSSNSCCMWFSAFVPLFVDVGLRVVLFAGFRNLPVQGRFCRNF
jgi:hypothetical protein